MTDDSTADLVANVRRYLVRTIRPKWWFRILVKLPGMKEFQSMLPDRATIIVSKRMIGIIDAMTATERACLYVIDASRKKRIARGAGVSTKDVGRTLKHIKFMRNLWDRTGGPE